MRLSEKSRAKIQVGIDKLAAQFANGEAVGSVARIMIEGDPSRPFMRWTASNRLLAFLLTGSTDCRTFKQWLEVDRVVMKGSKASYIIGPNMVADLDSDGKQRVDDKGRKMRRFAGYREFGVFPVTCTEGDELPPYDPPEPPELAGVAERWGIPITYDPSGRERRAYGSLSGVRPGHQTITLFTHDHVTFWHELSHAAHARVLADRGGKLRGGQDVQQEIVAEFSAAVLAEIYGYTDAHAHSCDYVERYAAKVGDSVGDALIGVLGDVQRVLTMILTADEREQGCVA